MNDHYNDVRDADEDNEDDNDGGNDNDDNHDDNDNNDAEILYTLSDLKMTVKAILLTC